MLVAAVLVALPGSASASFDDGPPVDRVLTADDLLPGSCFPEVVVPGQMVDCRFPLTADLPLDPWGPHVADLTVSYDDLDQAPCFVEADSLLCRNVVAYYAIGGHTVTPIISGVRSRSRATFQVVAGWRVPMTLSAAWGGEPYVFPGHPLEMYVDGTARSEPSFGVIRARADGRMMATIALPPVDPDVFEVVAVAPGALPPGRYVMTPCIGGAPLTCAEVEAGGIGFQVGTGRLREVVPGWNVATADRINVVFAPAGDTTVDAALEGVRGVLGWEGPMLLGEDGLPVTAVGETVFSIRFGPFATEPIRSARDRFNLWMLDDVLADPHALDHTAPPVGWDRPTPDFGLPDAAVTVVDTQFPGRYARSQALWPSFSSPDGPVSPMREDLVFGSSYLAVSPFNPLGWAETLTHEWGHALFDLRDEYVEYGRGVTYGYPNCAPDEATATAWWGALIGLSDPFVDEVLTIHEQHQVPIDQYLRGKTAVFLVPGGCYSPEADAVRPTEDSIMNSEIPVFGLVNRMRVEEVLSLWTGRAAFDLDLARPSCWGIVRREAVAGCSFVLPVGVDRPLEPVHLVAGSDRSVCVEREDTTAGIRYSCGVLRVDGAGVELTVGAAARRLVVSPDR